MSADELTFTIGQKVLIIRKEPDLWKGRCDGKVGWFPSDFVNEMDPEVAGEMSYTTIELLNCVAEHVNTDRPYSFRISQGQNHWNMQELIVAAETKEEMEDWLNNLITSSQCVNNKISLLRTKEKQLKIANELSSLVVYCQGMFPFSLYILKTKACIFNNNYYSAVPFDMDFALKDSRATFYEMCSFSGSLFYCFCK
jgi:hypothetical protein